MVSKEDYEVLEKYTMALFKRGTEIAKERGLILVDTKYEFGHRDGKIYLIDEIHTPDSSRYFYSEGYEDRFAQRGTAEATFQGVRPRMVDGKWFPRQRRTTSSRNDSGNRKFYQRTLHGTVRAHHRRKFVKADTENIAARIEKNVTEYLK